MSQKLFFATEITENTERFQSLLFSVCSDETTSHSTKADKNVSQVAGYVISAADLFF